MVTCPDSGVFSIVPQFPCEIFYLPFATFSTRRFELQHLYKLEGHLTYNANSLSLNCQYVMRMLSIVLKESP